MTHYSVRRNRPRHEAPAVLARLYVVTSALGARIYERKSVNSATLAQMPKDRLFQGTPALPWIRVLGGGYCVALTAREVV